MFSQTMHSFIKALEWSDEPIVTWRQDMSWQSIHAFAALSLSDTCTCLVQQLTHTMQAVSGAVACHKH